MTKEPCAHVHSVCHSPPHPGPVSPAGAKSRNGWVCVCWSCPVRMELSSAQLSCREKQVWLAPGLQGARHPDFVAR